MYMNYKYSVTQILAAFIHIGLEYKVQTTITYMMTVMSDI